MVAATSRWTRPKPVALTRTPRSTNASRCGRPSACSPRWSMLTEGSAVRMSASPGRSRGVDVELGVHAGQVVDAMGQAVEVLQVGGPAATQVEPHSAHAALPEVDDVGVGEVVRNLGDPDEPGPEPGEGVQQVVLVEPLERPGDDRAADD